MDNISEHKKKDSEKDSEIDFTLIFFFSVTMITLVLSLIAFFSIDR